MAHMGADSPNFAIEIASGQLAGKVRRHSTAPEHHAVFADWLIPFPDFSSCWSLA